VARTRHTTDHDEIREWVERHGGRPAQVEGTDGLLRIDFGEPEERLEPIGWDRFFDIFDRNNLEFVYDPNGYFNKFIERAARKTSSERPFSASSRGTRKKSSVASKKTTRSGGPKTSGRKYGKKSQEAVRRATRELKGDTLKSGHSGPSRRKKR